MPKKGRLGQFADLRGAWQERGGGAFEGWRGGGGGLIPQCTLCVYVQVFKTFPFLSTQQIYSCVVLQSQASFKYMLKFYANYMLISLNLIS